MAHRPGQEDERLLSLLDLNTDGVFDGFDPSAGGKAWLNSINASGYAPEEAVVETEDGLGFVTRARMKPGNRDGLYTRSNEAVF